MLLSHIWSHVKRRQSQSYKFKEFAKMSIFLNFGPNFTRDTPLKLLDKMCKYEMDPISMVEDTGRTRFCAQTHRRTDGQTDGRTEGETDKVKPVYPPFQLRWSGGYKNHFITTHPNPIKAYCAIVANLIVDMRVGLNCYRKKMVYKKAIMYEGRSLVWTEEAHSTL